MVEVVEAALRKLLKPLAGRLQRHFSNTVGAAFATEVSLVELPLPIAACTAASRLEVIDYNCLIVHSAWGLVSMLCVRRGTCVIVKRELVAM